MLQVLLFSVLFGLALAQLPDRGKLIVDVIDSALHGLFGIVGFIMRLAPLAALGAMAFTVGRYGAESLLSLLRLMGCFYLTCVLFVVVVLGIIALIFVVIAGGSYNRLVKLQQGVNSEWAQVQNVYQRRADLIPNLVATVSGAANFESAASCPRCPG